MINAPQPIEASDNNSDNDAYSDRDEDHPDGDDHGGE